MAEGDQNLSEIAETIACIIAVDTKQNSRLRTQPDSCLQAIKGVPALRVAVSIVSNKIGA